MARAKRHDSNGTGNEILIAEILNISRQTLNRYRNWMHGRADRTRVKPDDQMIRDIGTLDNAFAALREIAARRMQVSRYEEVMKSRRVPE